MRSEVQALLALGRLPPEQGATLADVGHREALIRAIEPPATLEESVALAHILGEDGCFGLAWSIVHIIESAPQWADAYVPSGSSPFLATLLSRLQNAGAARSSRRGA